MNMGFKFSKWIFTFIFFKLHFELHNVQLIIFPNFILLKLLIVRLSTLQYINIKKQRIHFLSLYWLHAIGSKLLQNI